MAAKKKPKEAVSATPDLSEQPVLSPRVKEPSSLLDEIDALTKQVTKVMSHKDFPDTMKVGANDALSVFKVLRFKVASRA